MRRQFAKDKELEDNARLLRAWRKWHAEMLTEALSGLHADVMRRLMAELKDLQSARKLVEFIAAQDWSVVDYETRLVALYEINSCITKLRERHGMEPINDPLGKPPSAFQLIKSFLSFPSVAGEARQAYSAKQKVNGDVT
jgi:hypothetical protein